MIWSHQSFASWTYSKLTALQQRIQFSLLNIRAVTHISTTLAHIHPWTLGGKSHKWPGNCISVAVLPSWWVISLWIMFVSWQYGTVVTSGPVMGYQTYLQIAWWLERVLVFIIFAHFPRFPPYSNEWLKIFVTFQGLWLRLSFNSKVQWEVWGCNTTNKKEGKHSSNILSQITLKQLIWTGGAVARW